MMTDTRRQRIAANRAAVRAIRERTYCWTCGAQPVDFHSDDHRERPSRRISKLVGTSAMATVLAEIERCTPLCRRCHCDDAGHDGPHRPGGHWTWWFETPPFGAE